MMGGPLPSVGSHGVMAGDRAKGTPWCSLIAQSDSEEHPMTRRKSTDAKSYAGLDVSLRETAVCVLNEHGFLKG
jgi:hypothetical protein